MTNQEGRAEYYLHKCIHAVVGFVGSYIILIYVFMFLGLMLPETDLTWPEQKMQSFMFWLTFALACGFGLFTVCYGTVKVSRFWLWFLIIFSLTSLLQLAPDNGGLRVELNLGWPRWTIVSLYVQAKLSMVKLVVLLIHVCLSLGLAWCFHSGWPRLFHQSTPHTRS